MASHGPVPKRDAERAGHRSADYAADKVELDEPVEIPEPAKHLHASALAWYDSLKKSGQSKWYEPSDWAKALLIADALSAYYTELDEGPAIDDEGRFRPVQFATAATLKVLFGEMASLGVTESDRRRMRIEIERKREQTEDELAEVIRGQFEALSGDG